MADLKPLCVDLCCGDFGGWAEGFLSEDYDVVGFDIVRNPWSCYPGQLILQDILTLHGSQFRNATVIVASPPCQAYSYRAMPWKRAKALPPPDNSLFAACFRIQREASEAARKHIPLVVENVKGAQPWVGRAQWHFGSFYLWGDIPALMPDTRKVKIIEGHLNIRDGHAHTRHLTNPIEHMKNNGGSWFNVAHNTVSGVGRNPDGRMDNLSRKAASSMIAKIPFPLAQHIARCFKPVDSSQETRL